MPPFPDLGLEFGHPCLQRRVLTDRLGLTSTSGTHLGGLLSKTGVGVPAVLLELPTQGDHLGAQGHVVVVHVGGEPQRHLVHLVGRGDRDVATLHRNLAPHGIGPDQSSDDPADSDEEVASRAVQRRCLPPMTTTEPVRESSSVARIAHTVRSTTHSA